MLFALTPSQFWLSFIATNLAILAIAMLFVSRYLAKGNPRRRYAMKM